MNANADLIKNIHSGKLDELPLAFFPNASIKGYCRTILDNDSLCLFLKNVSNVFESGERAYLWRTLADHVFLGRVKPSEFIESVR